MPAQGRLKDKSFAPADAHGCGACPHPVTGPAIKGSSNVFVNSLPALRVGDNGVHSACCGPNIWTAVKGSATVFINGRAAHRMGDQDQHCGGIGNLIEGSPNVIVGDSGAGGAAAGLGAGNVPSELVCIQAQTLKEAAKSGVPFCEKCREEPTTPIESVTEYVTKPTTVSKKLKVVELVEVFTQGGIEKIQTVEEREQYINLDESIDTSNPHPEYGRFIQLKARVKWDDDKKHSLAGETVYWKSLSDSANNQSLTGSEKEGFDSAGSGTEKKVVKVDDQGWTPIVKFYLSQYGGDKFDIYATTDPKYEGGLKAGTYTVWRKLWYEIDTMKKRVGIGTLDMDYNELPCVYEPCFIRFEKQGTDNQPNNKWNIETNNLHKFANDYFGAEKSPFQLHIVAIDHQADKKDVEITFELDTPVYIDSNSKSYYVYDGGDTWLKSAEFFSPEPWERKLVLKGEYYTRRWMPLEKKRVSLIGSDKVYKQIKIDLTNLTVIPPSPNNKIKVKLKYVESTEYTGDGTYTPHAMIATGYWYDRETETEAKKRIVGTMAHELGHLLGMVPSASFTYIATNTGPHCKDINCVMYRTNTPTRGNTFCCYCTEILRKTDITNYKNSFTHTKGGKAS